MYAAQAKVGRPFGTMLQIRKTAMPTENTVRRVWTYASQDDKNLGEVDCPKFQLSNECSKFKS